MSDRQEQKQEATGSPVSKAFHPTRAVCECERLGLAEDAECVYNDPCWDSEAAYLRASGVKIRLSLADAQAIYDHTGTMPWAPGSWSHNLRSELSVALHMATAPQSPPASASNAEISARSAGEPGGQQRGPRELQEIGADPCGSAWSNPKEEPCC